MNIRAVLRGKASPMSPDPSAAIRSAAIAWHIRLSDERAQDWDEFAEWLDRDPRHSRAYEAVAIDDAALDLTLAEWARTTSAGTNDNRPVDASPVGSRRWVGWGLGAAAAAAAALVFVTPMASRTDYYDIVTAPGEQRIVTLDGEDRIALNGGTNIRLDRKNPRFASLKSGEAAFSIVHDPKSPFELQLGDDRIVDIGTKFNVVRTAAGHTVEVSEGSILYNPRGEHITLAAGQALTSRARERRILLSRKPISDVGGWQHDRLSYRSATLTEVAADLSRNIGTPISVPPAIANRSFTGTIEIDRDESRMFARLAPLLDVEARRGAQGWTLRPIDSATR